MPRLSTPWMTSFLSDGTRVTSMLGFAPKTREAILHALHSLL